MKEATIRERQLVADAEASRETAKKAIAEARAAPPRMQPYAEAGKRHLLVCVGACGPVAAVPCCSDMHMMSHTSFS